MSDPLLVDVYAGDLNGQPNWPALIAAGLPWCGAVIKATEGLHYAPPWFGWQWRQLKNLAGARLGVTFFRGAYHYLRVGQGGASQADFFCDFIDAAGGWEDGDIWPIVDVERANNDGCTAMQVIGVTRDFTRQIERRTGKKCILYGGELLASLGIKDRMGCDRLWIARYTETLPQEVYTRIGWDLSSLFAWQYCGDGVGHVAGYPNLSPIGKVDVSALLVSGGGAASLEWLRG